MHYSTLRRVAKGSSRIGGSSDHKIDWPIAAAPSCTGGWICALCIVLFSVHGSNKLDGSWIGVSRGQSKVEGGSRLLLESLF